MRPRIPKSHHWWIQGAGDKGEEEGDAEEWGCRLHGRGARPHPLAQVPLDPGQRISDLRQRTPDLGFAGLGACRRPSMSWGIETR